MKLENNNTKIKFSTKELFMGLDCSDSIYLEDFTIIESNKNFLEYSKSEILRIKVENHIIPSNSLYIEDIKKVINEDIQVIYVLFQQSFKKDLFRGRISIIQKRNNPVEFIVQLSVNWHNDVPKKVLLQFPFLIELSKNNSFLKPGEIHDIDYPSKRCLWNFHESPPATLTDSSIDHSIGIQFRDEFPWQANYNLGISEAIKEINFELYESEVQPTNILSDIFVMRLYFSPIGRSEIFKLWKEDTRSRYDLRDYKIPESSWSQKSYLQHFTFAYGKEAFNYDNKNIDIEKLLEKGKEFGGYDSIIFWHQYPRLGLDETNQWDLYNYLPQGYSNIKEIVKICHKNDVRVFLPFKPWDIRSNESLDIHAKRLEIVINQTEIDGLFLDTMSTLPESFLRLKDKFPNFIFCSEGTPREPRQIEHLTSSWDQIGDIRRNFKVDIEANLFRFVFPEHPLYSISRWSVGSDKDSIIKRSIFNGMGIVIWQDVFGSWLPFSDDQKRKIKEYKNILIKYHACIFGKESVPIIDTLVPGLLCNQFSENPKSEMIYSFYNSTPNKICGSLLNLGDNLNKKCLQLYGTSGEFRIKNEDKTSIIQGEIDQNQVVMVLINY